MAGGGELKLLGVWTSPYVIRVRVVLNLKSLPYEYVEENLGSKSALLLGSNPVHKTVPVLLHGGRPVNESQVIVQYIDEVWAGTGPSVLPADPYERAVARFWAAYVDDKVGPAWLGMLFTCKTEEERAEAVARAVAALETLEAAFADCSKGKAFFGGDGIGFVDVVLGGYLGSRPGEDAAAGQVGGAVPRGGGGPGRRAGRRRQDARVLARPARRDGLQSRVNRQPVTSSVRETSVLCPS